MFDYTHLNGPYFSFEICFPPFESLALFYMSTKKLLAPQNPLLKFISVKGIILFAYWQTLLLSILAQFDYLEHPGAEQALLTALESVPSAILVAAAFPVKPYIQGYSPTGGSNDRLKQISGKYKRLKLTYKYKSRKCAKNGTLNLYFQFL